MLSIFRYFKKNKLNREEHLPPFKQELLRCRKLPQVCLYGLGDLGLIIDYPTGVAYFNQVGGYANHQLCREGLFVPIDYTDSHGKRSNMGEILHDFFTGPKWHGRCDCNMDEKTADFVDVLLAENGFEYIKVNREKLGLCREAWIEVVFISLPVRRYDKYFGSSFAKINATSGVLTWGNCD